ncbi:hypothetical protein EJ110_NYTH54593 [Nymphaea thermarum]|nr:hypothetical protein EJ110_NYTH54593 [Nymphaea thermarum]
MGNLPKVAGIFLPNLQELYVCPNKLNGSLPIELGSMPQLERLFILDNILTDVAGGREISILTYFTECRMKEEVYLSQNLPNGIRTASVLNLSFNQLEGEIPMWKFGKPFYRVLVGNDTLSELPNSICLHLVKPDKVESLHGITLLANSYRELSGATNNFNN